MLLVSTNIVWQWGSSITVLFYLHQDIENLLSTRHFCLIDWALHYSGKKFTFFLVFLLLVPLKYNARIGKKFFSAFSLITIVLNLRIATCTTWNVPKYRVFSGPNTGKYGPEEIRIWTLFSQWWLHNILISQVEPSSSIQDLKINQAAHFQYVIGI